VKTLIKIQLWLEVKLHGAITVLVVVFIMLTSMTQTLKSPVIFNEKVDKYFDEQLKIVKEKLYQFKIIGQKKASLPALKNQFFQCRLAYKKIAVLTDYFNQYETKSLNGPAIPRIESEIADKIIPPGGFQAIEQLLFSEWKSSAYSELISLLDEMLATLAKMKDEPDRKYKFSEELVWDAIRSAITELTTKGITGFDSPTANYSLPEAAASIEGIKSLLFFFKVKLEQKEPALFSALTLLSGKSVLYLHQNSHFNNFNRLFFIT